MSIRNEIGFIEKASECKAKKKDLGAVDRGHPEVLGTGGSALWSVFEISAIGEPALM